MPGEQRLIWMEGLENLFWVSPLFQFQRSNHEWQVLSTSGRTLKRRSKRQIDWCYLNLVMVNLLNLRLSLSPERRLSRSLIRNLR